MQTRTEWFPRTMTCSRKKPRADEEFVYEIKARPVGPLGAGHQVKQGVLS
ncbi:hypothetical protein P4V47_23650 [Brevibacillus laterosporus]|nr:hypothetical protein [Brevibacillus laterosporus]